jgi:hypothetical protein
LREFSDLGYPVAKALKVLRQDPEEGGDTGLVRVQLANATTVAYMQPEAPGAVRWVVTMEPREDPVVLDAVSVQSLSDELAMISALCTFLQEKSRVMLAELTR